MPADGMRADQISRRAVLLEPLTPAAEVGVREWQAEGSMLIVEDRSTRRKRIVLRVMQIALWTLIAVAFFEAIFSL